MRLYLKFMAIHLKVQLQNRTAFILLTLGQALLSFTGLFAVIILMDRDVVVAGFNRPEVLLAGSIVMMSYGLAECFFRGFDLFPSLLGDGRFDRMLVRPRNIIFQVLASTVDLSRFGRILVAGIILLINLQSVTITNYLLLFTMIGSGVFLFGCLFIIYGALSFFTTESLEFMNILTDGAREFGKVPFSFYGKEILTFLTFIIPLALFQYYPLLILLGKPAPVYYAWTPLIALLFGIPAYCIWTVGRRKYRSTGS